MKTCWYCEANHSAEDQWCDRECYDLWVLTTPKKSFGPTSSRKDGTSEPDKGKFRYAFNRSRVAYQW